MMRVGLVTGEFPPDRGGVGDFTNRLARALAALGHEIHVITDTPQTRDSEAAALETISHPSVHRRIRHWRFGCWREILGLSRDLELNILDVQYQAAAYAMHPAINLVPPSKQRPPLVVTFHDLKVPYLFPKAGPLRWWAVRILASRADGVIVTNREDELRLSDAGVPNLSLARIPIGSNITPELPADYDRQAERARWGVGPEDLLLGYFGFLNASKGGEELVETLALLVSDRVPAHLLKIGGRVGTSDPTNRAYAETVERLIDERGLGERVHWTGYLPAEEISATLCATDVCVLPFRDGVSLRRGSLHACLAHGRAIVTTRPAVPLPDLEDGRTALLVDPGHPAALAEAVMKVAADPALRSRLEDGAASFASRFEWDNIARETTAFFAHVISGSR